MWVKYKDWQFTDFFGCWSNIVRGRSKQKGHFVPKYAIAK